MRYLILFATCLGCSGAAFGPGDPTVSSWSSAAAPPGFAPTDIAGLAYYWNFTDLTTNAAVSSWVDRISGIHANMGNAALRPTNTVDGVLFAGGGIKLTNAALTVASNFSIWISAKMENTVGYHALIGPAAGGGNGGSFLFSQGNSDNFFAGGDHNYAGTFLLDYVVDTVWANGTGYSNGVAALTTTKPTSSFGPDTIGSDSFNNHLIGYIRYIGIWTNTALTSINVSNLNGFDQGFPDPSCPLSITQVGTGGADPINTDPAGPFWMGNAFLGNGSNLCRVDMFLNAFTNGASCATQNVYVTVGITNNIANGTAVPSFNVPVFATSAANHVPDSTDITLAKWIPFTFSPPVTLTLNQWYVIAVTADLGSTNNLIYGHYSTTGDATNISNFGEWQSGGGGGTNAIQNENLPTYGTGMRLYFSQ